VFSYFSTSVINLARHYLNDQEKFFPTFAAHLYHTTNLPYQSGEMLMTKVPEGALAHVCLELTNANGVKHKGVYESKVHIFDYVSDHQQSFIEDCLNADIDT